MVRSKSKSDSELRKYSKNELLKIYEALVFPRLIEEKMLLLLRQGRVSKWFSGIGQEAISVGSTLALQPDEYILPGHRNLGVFTTRKIPLERLVSQWQGKVNGFTKGRDRSFHFGTREYHIVGMISHLGAQLCVADGIALARSLSKEKKITLVFSGEGATSEGDFHEALNLASVWDLGVIFLIENNGYALSTPTHEQYRCEKLSDRAKGYGIEGRTIDGNNILEVHSTIQELATSIRKKPRPVLVECMTFRMRGHEEASGIKYVPKKLFEECAKLDPVTVFERRLLKAKILTSESKEKICTRLKAHLDEAIEAAFDGPEPVADTEQELNDVYAPQPFVDFSSNEPAKQTTKRFIDAISDGLDVAMAKHPELIIMGQDIAEYGGVFKVTDGMLKRYGRKRIRNTPICESVVIGGGLGLSVCGKKSIVEMQFADFVSCGFNQIVNNLAKSYYRWGQNADVVIRMPTGAGSAAGPFHSQSNEAWFTHTAGLKVVYPSNPYDAKGLLLAAVRDPNPVLFFEHKGLYRSVSGEVGEGYYEVPIGKAQLVKTGERVVVITYGAAVHWAKEEAEAYPEGHVAVLDLRSLAPIDWSAIDEVVKSCGRVVIFHEDTLTGGIGGEISAYIAQHLFRHLDAPVLRVGSLDTPVPFASVLEKNFLPRERFKDALQRILSE